MNIYRTNLASINYEVATGEVKSIYDKILKSLGFIPNLFKNMANQPGILKAYLQLSDLLKEINEFTPAEKDVIALAVSKYNECNYCIAVHTFTGKKMTNVPESVLNAINNNIEIPDKKIGTLFRFVQEVIKSRGFIDEKLANEFIEVGYNDKHILGIFLLISLKTLSNYTNHLFDTVLDNEFKS